MNKRQQGYTLLELLISMVLGLLMISGFGSLFMEAQKSSTIQRSLSWISEDGRYIMEVFGREIRRAGSLRDGGIGSSNQANLVFLADANIFGSTISFAAADHIKGQYDAAGFGASADKPFNVSRFALRYQLNNNTELAPSVINSSNSACERSIQLDLAAGDDPATQTHVVTIYFYIAVDTTNTPVLYCLAKRAIILGGVPITTVTSPTAEPLISNVQRMEITYGIDDNPIPTVRCAP